MSPTYRNIKMQVIGLPHRKCSVVKKLIVFVCQNISPTDLPVKTYFAELVLVGIDFVVVKEVSIG